MSEKITPEYQHQYKTLNKAQKEAVDSIDGPVMVVAGPGTGKTQVLALRIGNILLKTDTEADGILCLTFTNSGVSAMRDRLHKYIGPTASKINIFTFHGFGMEMIRAHYGVLGLNLVPKLMDDIEAVALVDQILHGHEWQYLRPRSNASLYFRDLKSLISLLKRERMSPEDFREEIKIEIDFLKNDESSISTRGESKGSLKKEIIKNIESLERTLEVVKFYELYEQAKRSGEVELLDYDDVLTYLVRIVEESEDVRDEIREKYLYVLIDEHQDSSGVQNEFLQKVWGNTERPNIFVVGDDRQLIYGFGGASIEYFESFKHSFGKAKLITLTENYRSTQNILDSSHLLLESSITKEKLISNTSGEEPISLVEADYPRDEIIACALDIQEKIKKGLNLNDCAILVPKNKQVRSTVAVLRDMGLPVASFDTLRLFDLDEAAGFFGVLKIISNPNDNVALSASFFNRLSGVEAIEAHQFLSKRKMRDFSLAVFAKEAKPTLFGGEDTVSVWCRKLVGWINRSRDLSVYSLVQEVGDELLLNKSKDHQSLVSRIEIIRTFLHLALSMLEKNSKASLADFVGFIERLQSYEEDIPLSVFGKDEGIKVLTLHASKGLEFEYVWIAHLDEHSLASGKRQGFALPPSVAEKVEQKNEEVLKRQLYVAITRAKRFCSVSYSLNSYTGASQELAHIVLDLFGAINPKLWKKQTSAETEKMIISRGPKSYVQKNNTNQEVFCLDQLLALVKTQYKDSLVSVSLLNNFFECPWKWYFRNLLQLPERKSDSLDFGNAVHGSLDTILKNKVAPSAKALQDIVKREVEKIEYLSEARRGQVEREVLGVVSGFVKNRLTDVLDTRESEKSVSLKDDRFPHLNIYGKIDLIEYLGVGKDGRGKSVRVTDFKTGSVRKKNEIEKMDEEGRMSSYLRQLAMYSYLLEQNPKLQINVTESRLEFLEAPLVQVGKSDKDAIYNKVITPTEIMLLVQDIKDYDKALQSGAWVNRPCNFKPYGRTSGDGACEYCKMAEIYKKTE